MILLYLLSLVAILLLFVPVAYIPTYIKWPSSFLVVFIVVFIFNVCKKDTIYLVKDSKKKIVNRGLFNPLLLYVSAVLYIFGFTLLSAQLKFYNVCDYIKDFNGIIEVFYASSVNNVLMGSILVVVSILIYYLRYLFKANAEGSSLRGRAFLYVGFSVILILVGLINILSFNNFNLADYLKTGYNWVFFLGLIGLVLYTDFKAFLIRRHLAKKRLIKSLVKAQRPDPVVIKTTKSVVTITRKERKAMKKQAKIDKIVAKKVAKIDEKRAKQEGKKPSKVVEEIKEVPLTRKDKKRAKKQAKKDKKRAKKQAKKDKKQAKKQAKKDRKQAKKDKKIAKKQGKNAKKYAKKEAKLDKKADKIKNKIKKKD